MTTIPSLTQISYEKRYESLNEKYKSIQYWYDSQRDEQNITICLNNINEKLCQTFYFYVRFDAINWD